MTGINDTVVGKQAYFIARYSGFPNDYLYWRDHVAAIYFQELEFV